MFTRSKFAIRQSDPETEITLKPFLMSPTASKICAPLQDRKVELPTSSLWRSRSPSHLNSSGSFVASGKDHSLVPTRNSKTQFTDPESLTLGSTTDWACFRTGMSSSDAVMGLKRPSRRNSLKLWRL